MTDVELGAFLSGPRNPEHEALLRLIGTSILDPQAAEVDDDHYHTVANPVRGAKPAERGAAPAKSTGYRPGRKTQRRQHWKKTEPNSGPRP